MNSADEIENSNGTYTPSALRLACRMLLDAGCDASQNQPVVCSTALLTGRMASSSTLLVLSYAKRQVMNSVVYLLGVTWRVRCHARTYHQCSV
jgi:hypothetical protein